MSSLAFSQAEKKMTVVRTEQIKKEDTVFTQNDDPLTILSENNCQFAQV